MHDIRLGDNLTLMEAMGSGTVKLIYADPPFGNAKNWVGSKGSFKDMDLDGLLDVMRPRLQEMHRLLSDHGSLYLHCDQTASHYLKVMLDCIFGRENFRNEIVWKRIPGNKSAGGLSRNYSRATDVILYYSKTRLRAYDQVYAPYDPKYLAKSYSYKDARGAYASMPLHGPGFGGNGSRAEPWRGTEIPEGTHWSIPFKSLPEWFEMPNGWKDMKALAKLDELDRQGLIHWSGKGRPRYKRYQVQGKGIAVNNLWTDIQIPSDKERVGYPTQKPLALLERIIRTSSIGGDVVLDPFCGSGTTLVAAQRLGRLWIGMDSSPEAVRLAENRILQEQSAFLMKKAV